MHNLFSHVYPNYLSSGLIEASATSTDYTTNAVDMRGYEGVAFLIAGRTCGAAAFTAYAQLGASSSSDATFIDVYGSTVSHTTGFNANHALEVIDVFRPKYRWARCVVDRGATGEQINSIIALQYRAGLMPTGFSTALNVSDVNCVIGTSS